MGSVEGRRVEWERVGEFEGGGGGGRTGGIPWRRHELKKSVWAKDEHERFVAALKRFGRDWKAIENSVGTRTAVQIRSHAQKYFIKLKRHNSTEFEALPPPRKKRIREQGSLSDSGGSSTLEMVDTPAMPNDTAGVHSETLSYSEYACTDALSLLVTAAYRMEHRKYSRTTTDLQIDSMNAKP